jgi:hypothetical protein
MALSDLHTLALIWEAEAPFCNAAVELLPECVADLANDDANDEASKSLQCGIRQLQHA